MVALRIVDTVAFYYCAGELYLSTFFVVVVVHYYTLLLEIFSWLRSLSFLVFP